MDANPSSPDPKSSEFVEPELSYLIVRGFYTTYNEFGLGFMEAHYVRALEIVLKGLGLLVEREHQLIVMFRGEQLGTQRVDLLVEKRIVVEVKAAERIVEAHRKQLRSYLACMHLRLGLLLNFGPTPQFDRVLCPQRRKSATTDSPNSPDSHPAV